MKASYAIVNACDELIVTKETEGSNKLLTMVLDPNPFWVIDNWIVKTHKGFDEI